MKKRKILPYLFISPFFILYLIFGLYPAVSGIFLSLQDKAGQFTLANYQTVFADTRFHKAISNAFFYMLGSMFIILPLALGAALMLNSKYMERKRGFVSTVFFMPNVTSVVIVGIVFKLILRTNNGLLNMILDAVSGGRIEPIQFLKSPDWALFSLLLIGTWKFFGVNSLYFLSGVQGIPTELGEAARIDGASKWKEFRYITLPLLKPITKFITFTCIVGSFSIFGEVLTLIGNSNAMGARDSMLYPMVYLYNLMFKNVKMNQAAAMGYVIAVILLLITGVQRWMFRDKE